MINTNNLINNVIKNENDNIKDYFNIDIDNLDWLNILYIISKIYANFTYNNSNVKQDLELHKLIRVFYSSSKTGVHIKVNIKNNFIENLYYRSLFNDDIIRVKQDLIRANNKGVSFTYDIAFKYKFNKSLEYKKSFDIIKVDEILKKCNMNKNTFYKLIDYLRENNMKKVSLVINDIKFRMNNKTNLYNSKLNIIINKLRNKDINEIEFNEEIINKFINILNKYSEPNKTKSLKNNYHTKLSLELCKAVYRYAKEN